MTKLDQINALSKDEAIQEFAKCCGTRAFATQMADSRPFLNPDALYDRAKEIWNSLSPQEWREAFDHHPRIGGTDELKKKFGKTAEWASQEQSGVAAASDELIARLADGNARYEVRFGHIFLVCATGKSAAEMLAMLETRMQNDPDTEFRIAAAEQAKITQIRLEKLLT